MTRFKFAFQAKSPRSREGRLVLNGKLIENSSALRSRNKIKNTKKNKLEFVRVYDTTATLVLVQCRLGEIAEHFDDLTLPLPEAPWEYFDRVKIVSRESDGIETLKFSFGFWPDFELWAKSWSISDFVSILKGVVEDKSISGLFYHQPGKDTLGSGFFLKVGLHTCEETVQQVLQHWLPIIRDVCEEAERSLAKNARKEALVALFRFAPEVKTACEQYLLYFGQFLEDLGVSATVNPQEQVQGVLFMVTPQSGPEALERIREALDVYLQMPRNPEFDAEVTRHSGIAVQQLSANVLHLRSQLVLAQAVLETKNATIEALQAANLQYKQLLSTNLQHQGQLTGTRADDPQKDETILGGTVTLTKYNWKGIQVNLPHIFRELRRRIKREN